MKKSGVHIARSAGMVFPLQWVYRPLIIVFLGFTTACLQQVAFSEELFDGVSLAGWDAIGDTRWTVSDGAIVGSGGDGYLVTRAVFESYRLQVEFRVDAETNSGVFIQCQDRQGISPLTCFEINIWDNHPRQEYRTGAIVTRQSPLHKLDTVGRWNRYDILVTPLVIKVTLNDVLVSHVDSPDKGSGFIALQRSNDGRVFFRRVSLRTLAQ